MPNIQKMLVLSIDHLAQETREALDHRVALGRPPWDPQLTWSHGWIWWVGEENPVVTTDFPDEFAAIFSLAMAHGCDWVRFDEIGDELAELPLFR